MEGKTYKFLDLSGYAFTGKHAVNDLVREFKGYHVPHFAVEFNLIRIQGGIRDLETALVEDWSPIRSDAAIRRFKRLVVRLGWKNEWLKPKSWFSAVGWNYDAYYGGRFLELSREYIDRLVDVSWIADWPYPLAEISGIELFARKFLRLAFRVKRANDFRVCLAAPEDFLGLTRRYLQAVLASNVGPDMGTIVMNNAFEPFNPGRALRYFDSAKAVIVDRDPRDSYVAGLWYRPNRLPVEEFIRRFKFSRRVAGHCDRNSSRVLSLRFEDLVLDYKATVAKILTFLEESPEVHVREKEHFKPDESKKNIGLWKRHDDREAIDKIHHELKEFCYE